MDKPAPRPTRTTPPPACAGRVRALRVGDWVEGGLQSRGGLLTMRSDLSFDSDMMSSRLLRAMPM